MALQRSRVLLNRHKFAGSDIAFRIPVMSSKFQDKKAAASFLQQCAQRARRAPQAKGVAHTHARRRH
jgi:hypothetical protein